LLNCKTRLTRAGERQYTSTPKNNHFDDNNNNHQDFHEAIRNSIYLIVSQALTGLSQKLRGEQAKRERVRPTSVITIGVEISTRSYLYKSFEVLVAKDMSVRFQIKYTL